MRWFETTLRDRLNPYWFASVIETCRRRSAVVLDFLGTVLAAARRGLPLPALPQIHAISPRGSEGLPRFCRPAKLMLGKKLSYCTLSMNISLPADIWSTRSDPNWQVSEPNPHVTPVAVA